MHNIRLDIREVWWEGVDWIHLAQDRDQWRALVKTVMNEISGFHGGKDSSPDLLGCDAALCCGRIPCPEDGGSMVLRNVGIPPHCYTASRP